MAKVSDRVELPSWVPCSGGNYPPNALEAGSDRGDLLYVIRAVFNDTLIPGKLHAGHKAAFISWNGQVHAVYNYEVLKALPDMLRWVPLQIGMKIPNSAVIGGSSESGEPYFIGRSKHDGNLTPGKVLPSHGVCSISYQGQVVCCRNYEILMR